MHALGGVPEWTNGALSKSVRVLKASSGVRIPPPPRMKNQTQIIYNLVVIILALVGVIIVLALYVAGVIGDFTPTQSSIQSEVTRDIVEEPELEPQSQEVQQPEQTSTSAPLQPTTTSTPQPEQQPQPAQPFNDKDCGDFQTHAQAQAFFESQGGPAQDPHKLDRNKDGVVCESLR